MNAWSQLAMENESKRETDRLQLVARVAELETTLRDLTAWQPIETAPKDRFVFVYCPEDDTRWLAKWQAGAWHGVDEHGLTRTAGGPEYVTGWKVTRWMSLPAKPKD